MAEIKSINELLDMNLNIPHYQRPYKWDIRNIEDLFFDITNALEESKKHTDFKYRIGTIILHRTEDGIYDIVDGQQRIISLVLFKKYLEPKYECSILKKNFTNKITQFNIHRNYTSIRERFSGNKEKMKEFDRAFENILEVVVVCVDKVTEAFQLFDSQNTRGKALDPHDLLKAYHLREMKAYHDRENNDHPYEMERAVTKWEAKDTAKIKELFDMYLYPIWNWSRGIKSKPFTAKEIDTYKGIPENSTYSYARRARKAMPYFQITEPFIAGNDFFEMVDHYMYLLRDIKAEIYEKGNFKEIKEILCCREYNSVGFVYAKNLFFCALLCYYDKFHNFDDTAVKKLFLWAFMLRVDMENLGFDSVNKYAVGEDNFRYTNKVGMFSKISLARTHYEISGMRIEMHRTSDAPTSGKWSGLYNKLNAINENGGAQ